MGRFLNVIDIYQGVGNAGGTDAMQVYRGEPLRMVMSSFGAQSQTPKYASITLGSCASSAAGPSTVTRPDSST